MSPRAARPVAPLRLLLVDDSRAQRDAWHLLLSTQPDFEIVGQAGDGAQALAQARRTPVDVVLMDVQMPRVNGLTAAGRLLGDAQVRAQGPDPRILLFATVDVDTHVPGAAEAGAFAVLYKDVEPEALFAIIRDAAAFGVDA